MGAESSSKSFQSHLLSSLLQQQSQLKKKKIKLKKTKFYLNFFQIPIINNMKAFLAICALIAVAAAAPNGGYGGGSSYGGQTIQMQPSGSPPVHNVPNQSYGNSVTHTAPGATYQAAPITYAAPMLTFNPPNINYNGQSVTYATSAQSGGNTQSYQQGSGGYSQQTPQVQNYQPSMSSGYSSGGSSY